MPTLSTAIPRESPSPAIIVPTSSPEGLTISYPELSNLISRFQSSLAEIGITAHSAVSIALPNTLPFVVSFFAVANQRSIAAPLNPAYTQAEFEFYIDDLKSKLIIVPPGSTAANAPSVRAARKFGAAVAEVWWDNKARDVKLKVTEDGKQAGRGKRTEVVVAQEEDVALVLHTSGTTGRPKAVPLSHKNLTRTMCELSLNQSMIRRIL